LNRAYEAAVKRKGSKTRVIRVVARKLVNVVWAVLMYEQEFMVKLDKLLGGVFLFDLRACPLSVD